MERLSRRAGRIRNTHEFALTMALDERFVDPEVARAKALASIAEHELDKRGPLSKALQNVTAGTPELVQRIDVIDWYYYLIPLFQGDLGVGLARTDAVNGTFMGVSAAQIGVNRIRSLREVVSGAPERRVVAPTLIWKPCQESTSPFQPLHAAIGQRGLQFLDQSGIVYPTLTPLGRGD